MAEGFNAQGASNYATYAANQCLKAAETCQNIADGAAVNASKAVTQSEEAVATAQGAASKADAAETSSSSAVETANDAKATVEEIAANEAARVSAEQARVIAEAARAAQFAEILDAIQGAQIRILSSDEYDENGVPTITGAPGIIYFVPISGTTHNTFTEWAYINDGWEVIGTTNTTIKGIDTDTIDRIVGGETVAGDEVVKTTTLSYLWTWLTQKFAAKIHSHDATGIDDKAITQAKIADGAVGETQLETSLRNSIFQQVDFTDRSITNLLNVMLDDCYADVNKPCKIATNDAGSLINRAAGMPSSGAYIAMREVHWFSSSHVMVVITEAYPVAGRVWANFYNTGKWDGWQEH